MTWTQSDVTIGGEKLQGWKRFTTTPLQHGQIVVFQVNSGNHRARRWIGPSGKRGQLDLSLGDNQIAWGSHWEEVPSLMTHVAVATYEKSIE